MFPSTMFGQFGMWPRSSADVGLLPASPQLQGIERLGTAEAFKLVAVEKLDDASNPQLGGSYSQTVFIATDTLFWLRWERIRTYEDGATLRESYDWSDYNVPNVVTAPRTNPTSPFVPSSVLGPADTGELAVRLCRIPASVRVTSLACAEGGSPGPAGVAISISKQGDKFDPFQTVTTDASGIAVFDGLSVFDSTSSPNSWFNSDREVSNGVCYTYG